MLPMNGKKIVAQHVNDDFSKDVAKMTEGMVKSMAFIGTPDNSFETKPEFNSNFGAFELSDQDCNYDIDLAESKDNCVVTVSESNHVVHIPVDAIPAPMVDSFIDYMKTKVYELLNIPSSYLDAPPNPALSALKMKAHENTLKKAQEEWTKQHLSGITKVLDIEPIPGAIKKLSYTKEIEPPKPPTVAKMDMTPSGDAVYITIHRPEFHGNKKFFISATNLLELLEKYENPLLPVMKVDPPAPVHDVILALEEDMEQGPPINPFKRVVVLD